MHRTTDGARRATITARAVVLLLLALLVASCTPGNGPGGPGSGGGFVGRSGRWFVDPHGRVIGMRGINFVQKFPPVAPEAVGFDEDDAAFLAREGFNVVRLGVVFGSVMPAPGVIDDEYVEAIARTTRVLAQEGIYVLLDFHQDGYGPLVNGNGFPEWATLTDGLPNPDVGFPDYYIANPALQRAFDNFWENEAGPDGVPLQEHYASALQAIAREVAHERLVIGYDLMNEPWPGTEWEACLTGCPELERSRLVPFEQRMTAAIREVDPNHLVFSEPWVLFNFGLTGTVVPDATTPDAALSFHVYAVSAADEPKVVANALAAADANDVPPVVTEFGATNDPGTITRIANTIETGLVPWMFWTYDEHLVVDKAQPPTDANLRLPVLGALARPYAAVTAGTPRSWAFDAATGDLQFSYAAARPSGTKGVGKGVDRTELVLPARAYPDGYRVTVTGGRVVSPPCAEQLAVERNQHAKVVHVHVTRGSCA
jgi:endoglycosylceramidase